MTRQVYRSPKKNILSNGQKSSRKRSVKKAWSVLAWAKWVKVTKAFLAKALFKKKKTRKRLASRAANKSLRGSVSKPLQTNKKFADSNQKPLRGIFIKLIKNIVIIPVGFLVVLALRVFGLIKLGSFIERIGRVKQIALILGLIFSIVGVRLAFIQLPIFNTLTNPGAVLGVSDSKFTDGTIIKAARGKIFIKDLAKNSTLLVAANRSVYDVVIYPKQIAEAIANEKSKFDLNQFITKISAATNVNFFEIQDRIQDALNRYDTQGTKYFVLIREASNSQFVAIQNLTDPPLDKTTQKPIFESYRNYILAEPQNSRAYPEKTMLAATIGFNRENTAGPEASKIGSCRKMVDQNTERGTESLDGYTTGQYGVERAFCSELGGVNGKISFSKNGLSQYSEVPAIQGSDIVLTIDKNIQAKAEEVLQRAIDANSNANGKPVSGTILVSEVATGKILARASYPFFDPNNVSSGDYETYAVKDQASVAYDPGSVIKPLTISAARDVYEQGKVKNNGKRIGVPIDFQTEDVDDKGLIFTSTDGRDSVVRNADNRSFSGVQSNLSDILRNSINTMIARIQKDYLDNETTRYYFLDKFKLGDWSDSFLYTSEPPNTNNFDKDINSPFSYANMAFGQGFTTTPLNLIRAYSAIANGGCMVEPRIVETLNNQSYRASEKECNSVIEPKVAGEVTQMLQNTLEIGFGNGVQKKPSKAKMDLYTGAAKTGTAQIARPILKKDKDGVVRKIPCGYACNSNLGLFDHTFIGFAPASNPKIIVLVKLSQPKPGDRNVNYAEFSSATFWKDITEYSLSYLGVKPDR